MLLRVKFLHGCSIHATDGHVGKLDDIYFNDQTWALRYLVVQTGNWLIDRCVLLAPTHVRAAAQDQRQVTLALNREQVRRSAGIDTATPVCRQLEFRADPDLKWRESWTGAGLWGEGMYGSNLLVGMPLTVPLFEREQETYQLLRKTDTGDPHLRSTEEVIGYDIIAEDGVVGHLEDMQISEESWQIRGLVMSTSHWRFGWQVILPPEWVRGIDAVERQVAVAGTRELLWNGPRP